MELFNYNLTQNLWKGTRSAHLSAHLKEECKHLVMTETTLVTGVAALGMHFDNFVPNFFGTLLP